MSVDDLALKNNISDKNLIFVGDTLTLNDENTENLGNNEQYVVQAGDTLSFISEKTGVSVDDLMNINDLSSDVIYVGQVLDLVDSTDVVSSVPNVGSEQIVNDSISTRVPEQFDNSQNINEYVGEQQSNYVEPTYNDQSQNNQSYNVQQSQSNISDSEQSSKDWIAQRESGGSYSARNGQYVGKFQLTDSYLNGDYSAENQERTADNYVAGRYGSWSNAKNFWLANGWY